LREDFSRGATTGNAALVIDLDDDRFPSLTVELDTLDSLASGLELDRIDVMKVDIEGHEDFFLRGARNTIAQARPPPQAGLPGLRSAAAAVGGAAPASARSAAPAARW
jgi:hypothetical protein